MARTINVKITLPEIQVVRVEAAVPSGTSFVADLPLLLSGGHLSISESDTDTDGYLSSADWDTFNNKQSALGFTPENVANKDTDGTLAANSDTKYASQKATKTYADTKQSALGFTPENVANKDTDGTLAANSDTKYASQKATKTYVDNHASLVVFSNPGGRLTTESGVPVSTSDRTSQGTLYYTPYKHNNIYTYSGTAWQAKTFSEISLALTLTSGMNYDVFINSAATTLSLSAAWASDTARTDALATQDGVTVLSSDHTKLWLGTIRASGSNVTEDSAGGTTSQTGGKRFVWNAYNQVTRSLKVIDTTDNWTYGTNTIRQANAASGNKVEYVTGDTATQLDVSVHCNVSLNGSVAVAAKAGVGLDSTTTFSGLVVEGYVGVAANVSTPLQGHYNGYPGLGYHYFSWNEKGADGSFCGFLGDNGGDGSQSGLIAVLPN